MEYRVLGKTGLKISSLGFGGIPIQKIDAAGPRVLMHKLFQKDPVFHAAVIVGLSVGDIGTGDLQHILTAQAVIRLGHKLLIAVQKGAESFKAVLPGHNAVPAGIVFEFPEKILLHGKALLVGGGG